MTTSDDAEIDAIADALGRLRGLRRPGPPFGGPPFAGPPFGGRFGGAPGGRGGGGDRAGHGDHSRHGARPHHGDHPASSDDGATRGRFGGGRMAGLARMRMLEALATASHPLSVGEIGEAIGVDQPRASRLIQQAVELGLARREADPDDARRTRVALTDEGARLAHGVRGERREKVAEALVEFSSEERAELGRLLAKLAKAWPHD
ncbi:MAG: MarR family winged helix-turn-helix transcriptional regulator [Microbacterium arborescens]